MDGENDGKTDPQEEAGKQAAPSAFHPCLLRPAVLLL